MSKFIKVIVIVIVALVIINGIWIVCAARSEDNHPEYIRVKATAYCLGTLRCDGKPIRTGVIAGKPEWYGKLIAVYEDNDGELGDFIGYFECLDTGGSTITNGKVVDIYNPSYDWCINFGVKNVIIVLIDGKG